MQSETDARRADYSYYSPIDNNRDSILTESTDKAVATAPKEVDLEIDLREDDGLDPRNMQTPDTPFFNLQAPGTPESAYVPFNSK